MKENRSGGIGFFGLLTVALIVLKLSGIITWSWALVFLPILIYTAVVFVLVIVLIFLGGKR